MTGSKLFRQRVMEEWKYQLKVIGAVLDWTIIVYLVIPGIIIAPFLYQDLWENINLYWSDKIPVSILFFLILLLSSSGNFRTYLREADLLYLLQKQRLMYQLKWFGFVLSLAQAMLGSVWLITLALPFLIEIYDFSSFEVLSILIAILAYRILLFTLKKIVTNSLSKYILFPLTFVIVMLLHHFLEASLFLFAGLSVIVSSIIFHLMQMTKTNRWFFREIEIENTEFTRFIKLIFTFSTEIEKEVMYTRKRPFLFFRNSGRIYNKRNGENGLLELVLKSFIRNKTHLNTYLRLTFITGGALAVLPLWIKWLIYFGFLVFFHFWLKSIYDKMQNSPFFAVVPFEKELRLKVWLRFRKLLYLPSIIYTGMIAILATIIIILM